MRRTFGDKPYVIIAGDMVILTNPTDGLAAAGIILMVIGFIGVFIPILPGPVLIWVGALLWAINDQFARVGWPTLAVMAALMVGAWGSDLVLTSYFTKRSSSSWLTVLGSIIGGIAGGIFLSPAVPIIGSIIGVIIGAMLGVVIVELFRKRQLRPALQASGAYLKGCIAGQLVELIFAVLMVALFMWQASA